MIFKSAAARQERTDAQKEMLSAREQLERKLERVEKSGPSAAARPLMVLIVDDEPNVGRVFSRVLERTFGAIVDAVDSSDAALARIKVISYDLVLVDLKLGPQDSRDGTDLIREIRREAANKTGPTVPAILISGIPEEAAKRLPRLGASFLPKPVDSATLVDSVRKLTGR